MQIVLNTSLIISCIVILVKSVFGMGGDNILLENTRDKGSECFLHIMGQRFGLCISVMKQCRFEKRVVEV